MMSTDRTSIVIQRRFEASPERVFDAWLEPELISKWMLAPSPSDRVLRVQVDARVGGKFSFLIQRQGQKIDHFGEYLEIERPRRLVFTFDAKVSREDEPPPSAHDPSILRLEFEADGAGTLLRLTQERVIAEYAERSERGFRAILAAVAASLAA